MIRNARLLVSDWDGTYRHTRHLEHADPALQMNVPSDGFEATRNGHGDCLECTWRGVWPSLKIEERDILELDSLDENGVWTREWAGVTVKSGNSQVTWAHTNFKAAGLKKRCTEVRLVADVAEGDAGAQLRGALQSVIASGQLGQAIVYDAALIPDTGMLLSAYPAKGRKLSDLCDYLAGQTGRVWGVDADRKLFLRAPGAGVISLTEGLDVVPTYEDTDSEALATQVMLNLGNWKDGNLIQYPANSPDAGKYGPASVDVTPDPNAIKVWATTGLSNQQPVNTVMWGPNEVAYLTDRNPRNPDGTYPMLSLSPTDAAQPFSLSFTLTAEAWRIALDAVWFKPNNLAASPGYIEVLPPSQPAVVIRPVSEPQYGLVFRLMDWAEARTAPFPAGTVVRLVSGNSPSVLLGELRPERPNTAVLTPLAQFHMVTPRRDPATITVRGRVTPQPNLRLMRTDGTPYETTTESVGLHIKLDAPGVSVIKAGQREAAEVRAKRWLDSQALSAATMDAVRFGSGS